MRHVLFAACAALAVLSSAPVTAQSPAPAPRVQVVDGDIHRFWAAYDAVRAESDPARQRDLFQRLYIDQGTPGPGRLHAGQGLYDRHLPRRDPGLSGLLGHGAAAHGPGGSGAGEAGDPSGATARTLSRPASRRRLFRGRRPALGRHDPGRQGADRGGDGHRRRQRGPVADAAQSETLLHHLFRQRSAGEPGPAGCARGGPHPATGRAPDPAGPGGL